MYRFKLEALLKHRRHQEEVLQKELADAQKKLAAEQSIQHALERKKRRRVQELQRRQTSGNTITDIVLYLTYIEHLSANIEDQKQRVQIAQQIAHQKRNELIASMKKRKALEKLKEKGRQAYQYKQMQEERKFMDEVASARHGRRI